MLGHFFHFFPHCELSHFSPSIQRQWVPPEHNSSYNFILIFLELCTCFLHSLKMCMCFSYNPCIIFCHFFVLFELCHLLTSDIYRQWVPCDCYFTYNLKLVFLKLCTCFLPGLQEGGEGVGGGRDGAGATSASPNFDFYYYYLL